MQPGPTMKHHHTTHVTGWQLPINQQTSINNDTEKWEHPSSHYRKQDEGSSKTDKTSTTGHSNSVSGSYPKNKSTHVQNGIYTPVSIIALCTIVKMQNGIKNDFTLVTIEVFQEKVQWLWI